MLSLPPGMLQRFRRFLERLASTRRSETIARTVLSVAVLLPYWRLLTLNVVYVTDDGFTSDIFNGELPGRVLVGRLFRSGEFPAWTSDLCSGLSLAGAPMDPLGAILFTFLPPAPALDLFVIVLLLVAAHGGCTLARRLGADWFGAVLCGVAFAGSGYIASQLKHLAIIATVAWLPYGMTAVHSVLSDRARSSRGPRLPAALFGLLFANQVLAGFPQSVYICALVYAAFGLTLAVGRAKAGGIADTTRRVATLALGACLGAAAGAMVLLPLAQLAEVSDRAIPHDFDWATIPFYWPPNLVTFLIPYFHGDISDNTYRGLSLFWEDYGYIGAAPVLLAIYAVARERPRPVVTFVTVMTIVAYLFVLGRSTPFFGVAYSVIPGLSQFRFPTRFLIVVELGLALMGAIGLTRLRADLLTRSARTARAATGIAAVLVAGTVLDLLVHQPRQNPLVPAGPWLSPPASARLIRADLPEPRTFTPLVLNLHYGAFLEARGWADVAPYFRLREFLQPNTGGAFWNLPSAECYAGVAPRWYADTWGDHNRATAFIPSLALTGGLPEPVHITPVLANVLRTFGVTHVLTERPQTLPGLTPVAGAVMPHVNRVDGAARVRFVERARVVGSLDEAVAGLSSPDFDPDREVLLHDVPEASRGAVSQHQNRATPFGNAGQAAIVSEDNRHVAVDVTAPQDGFLLLADTFFPGWSADVDGTAVSIYRANISVRAVPVSAGRHRVDFRFDPPGVRQGITISIVAIVALLAWCAVAAYADRRARLLRQIPDVPATA